MNIFWQCLKLQWLQLWREWGYLFGTMVVPSLFFLFFALPNAKDAASANLLFGSFSAFAFLGVVLLFGPKISRDRSSEWSVYLRTLPISGLALILGYAVCVLLTAICAVFVMQIVIGLTSPVDLSWGTIAKLESSVFIGGLPFILLAVLIGWMVNENSALPLTNAFYLILSYLGGLWIPPKALPEQIQKISDWTPTRHLGELAWAATLKQAVPGKSISILAAYSILEVVLLYAVLYRRGQI